MSNEIKNALITGADHNGMVAACYLAKADRRVTVVEAYPSQGRQGYLEFVSSISLMMAFVLRFMRSHPTRINFLVIAIGAVKLLMRPMKPWGMTRFISSNNAACICVLSDTYLSYPREQA